MLGYDKVGGLTGVGPDICDLVHWLLPLVSAMNTALIIEPDLPGGVLQPGNILVAHSTSLLVFFGRRQVN